MNLTYKELVSMIHRSMINSLNRDKCVEKVTSLPFDPSNGGRKIRIFDRSFESFVPNILC